MKRKILFLIVVTFLVYSRSLFSGFVWDDYNNIVYNEELKTKGWGAVLRPPAPYWRPFSYLTIIFDYYLWGNNPLGYHLSNIVFHISCIVLVFLLIKELFPAIAFPAALVFAVYPLWVESVSYISGRSDILAGLFLILSFYFFIKDKKFYFLSLLSFSFALLSKEAALIFPFLLLIFGILFKKYKMRKTYPFFMTAFIFVFIYLKKTQIPFFWADVNNFPKYLLSYLYLFLFPFQLHPQHNLGEVAFIYHLPLVVDWGSIFLLAWGIKRSKKEVLKFSFLFFLIALFPFLGIFNFPYLAEHFLYLPGVGLSLLLAYLLTQKKLLKNIILPLLVIVLSFLTIKQTFFWRDDITFYKYVLRSHPQDYKFYYNLGNSYYRRGKFLQAKDYYQKALFFNPHYFPAKENLKLSSLFISKAFAEKIKFDHSLYGKVLKEYLKNGKFNYSALKDNPLNLNLYLRKLSLIKEKEFSSFSREEKLALYINAYNAFTIKAIIDHYPVRSIKDIKGVWDKLKFNLAGKNLTLGEIEHKILRARFKEPRVHFALVCASLGCPVLRETPYSAENIYQELDEEAKKFINNKSKVYLDERKNTLFLSSIFKWFKKDFGDVVSFVIKYLPETEAEFIRTHNPRIKYLKYDWGLNGLKR